jgi:hypothetical protein
MSMHVAEISRLGHEPRLGHELGQEDKHSIIWQLLLLRIKLISLKKKTKLLSSALQHSCTKVIIVFMCSALWIHWEARCHPEELNYYIWPLSIKLLESFLSPESSRSKCRGSFLNLWRTVCLPWPLAFSIFHFQPIIEIDWTLIFLASASCTLNDDQWNQKWCHKIFE